MDRARKLWPLAAAAILAAAGAVAFLPFLDGPFLFDDFHTIVQNPALKTINPVFFLTHPESASRLPGTMIRPLLTLSYALDLRRAGPDPAAFRLVNIILHLGCSLLVFALAGRTRLRAFRLETALLFLLLPLSAVQVGYVSNRSVLLSALFYLGGLALFAGAADRSLPRAPALAGMVVCYAIGLLCKDSAATLPAAVALWGAVFWGRREWKLTAGATAALLAVFGGYLAYRLALRAPTLFPPARPWPVWAYAASQVLVTFRYLWWMICPTNLALAHDAWVPKTAGDLVSGPFLAALAGLAGVAALGVRARRAAPELAFGVGLFFLYLLPTNSVIPLVMPANENRPYLSAVLVVLALVAAAALAQKLERGIPARIGLVAIAALFLVLGRGRAADFSSPLAAWRQAVAQAPHDHRAWHNLGLAYLDYGRTTEARQAFQRALAAYPCAAQSLNSLGNLADEDRNRAMDYYRRALECDPSATGARLNLAEEYLSAGQYEASLSVLVSGLRYDPQNPELPGRIGEMYARRNEPAARDYLLRALALETDPARRARWSRAASALSE